MTLQWIPLDQLQAHPENSNRMPPRLLEKLKRHIQRTGLYEPLVVRPINCELRNADCGLKDKGTRPPTPGQHATPYLAPGEYTGGEAAKGASAPGHPPCIHGGLNKPAKGAPSPGHPPCIHGGLNKPAKGVPAPGHPPCIHGGLNKPAKGAPAPGHPPCIHGGLNKPAKGAPAPGHPPCIHGGLNKANATDGNPQFAIRNPQSFYQILNGHHRAEALRQLGHTHARCDVWNVSDEDALVLLATLNRLEGRDDPAARARLVAKLAGDRSPEDIARLLPEPADAVARLLALAAPPPEPLAPQAAAPAARPMTFFLSEEQHTLVREALAEAAREPYLAPGESATPYLAPGEYTGGEAAKDAPSPCRPPCIHGGLNTACSRAEALERIALWYLEARNLR